MRNFLLLFLLWLLVFVGSSYADLVVIFNNQTSEVFTVSEKDDTQVPVGYSKDVISGNFKTYAFDTAPTNYKYIDKNFIKNLDKINDEYNDKQEQEEIAQEQKLVDDFLKDYAITELEKDGKTFKHKDKLK